VTVIHPTIFYFNGHPYSLVVDYDIPMKEIKERISVVLGGGIPAEQLVLLWEGAEMDDDMTLSDVDYGPESAPLNVQEKGEPAGRTIQPPPPVAAPLPVADAPPTVAAPPPVATVTYLIGLELGIVPRFTKFPFPPATPLHEMVPALKEKWGLGDLEIEFALMDQEGGYRYISPQTKIGDIDHTADAVMVRPAGTLCPIGSLGASLRAASIRVPVEVSPSAELTDDPPPSDSSHTRVLFKIDQRGQNVRLVFEKTAKVEDARVKVATKLGVGVEAITLQFSGKALKDNFIVDRLRVGEQGINVYIKDDTEVLLLTAKAYRRPA
jgi:hypothetical protein